MHIRSLISKVACAALALGATMLFTGCGPTQKERAQLQYWPKAYDHTVSTDKFPINPPDVITIHSPLAPEVNGLKQQVAPDGTLNLDLLGRVYVAGSTPQQIEDILTQKLKVFYNDVKVRLDIDYHSQQFYVFGEVAKPGVRPYSGRDSLVATLADAQVTHLGWPERIYVIRASPDPNERHVTVINLKEIIQRGDATSNVLLQQDDIVYVPLNPLAYVGVQVQNLLYPVEPVVSAVSSAKYAGF